MLLLCGLASCPVSASLARQIIGTWCAESSYHVSKDGGSRPTELGYVVYALYGGRNRANGVQIK